MCSTTPNLNLLKLDPADGERLSEEEYDCDFFEREPGARVPSWRFQPDIPLATPDDPSWQAFQGDDLVTSLELLQRGSESWQEVARADRKRGATYHRVRVCGQPLTRYTWWELHDLHVQALAGMPVQIIETQPLAAWKQPPDVVIVGGNTLYHILYTSSGTPDGAIRYSNPDLIENWTRFIQGVFEEGEDLRSFFRRRISNLPPPHADSN